MTDNICDICLKKFSSRSSLSTHVKKAKYCLKKREEKELVQKEKVEEQKPEPVCACDMCGSRFSSAKEFDQHHERCNFLKSFVGKFGLNTIMQILLQPKFISPELKLSEPYPDERCRRIEAMLVLCFGHIFKLSDELSGVKSYLKIENIHFSELMDNDRSFSSD